MKPNINLPISVTAFLREKQRVSGGFRFTYKGQLKVVPNAQVRVYCLDLKEALSMFKDEEIDKLIIEKQINHADYTSEEDYSVE